jgi:hypothetical protein
VVKLNESNKLSLKNSKSNCCSSSCNCSESSDKTGPSTSEVLIEFLYLDLNTCTRCKGADDILQEALDELVNIFEITGVNVILKKINISSINLAKKYKFLSSPTIRVNGIDIQQEFLESDCQSCGDICNDSVDCRVWIYKGNEYNTPPKALIVEQLIKNIYCDKVYARESENYIVPKNIKRFFNGSKVN